MAKLLINELIFWSLGPPEINPTLHRSSSVTESLLCNSVLVVMAVEIQCYSLLEVKCFLIADCFPMSKSQFKCVKTSSENILYKSCCTLASGILAAIEKSCLIIKLPNSCLQLYHRSFAKMSENLFESSQAVQPAGRQFFKHSIFCTRRPLFNSPRSPLGIVARGF